MQRREYSIGAEDVEGNTTVEKLIVDFNIPSISIVDVQSGTGEGGTITAEITQDLDEASVQFQRKRRG